jgi:hypothetical protein
MTVTMIKKIKLDGAPCRKCADVIDRLERAGLTSRIDRVVVADERDADSEGMRMAAELGVDAAPFFVVERGGERTIYTSYVKLLKEVLEAQPSETDEAVEIAANTANIDFL